MTNGAALLVRAEATTEPIVKWMLVEGTQGERVVPMKIGEARMKALERIREMLQKRRRVMELGTL